MITEVFMSGVVLNNLSKFIVCIYIYVMFCFVLFYVGLLVYILVCVYS
jgi:hypothetical protein